MDKENRTSIFKMFTKLKLVIKDSDIRATVGDSFLPDYIIINNGDVFEIRKTRKILSYTNYDEDSANFKHRKVMKFPNSFN